VIIQFEVWERSQQLLTIKEQFFYEILHRSMDAVEDVPEKIVRPKKEEEIGGCRKMRNEKFITCPLHQIILE
jgi:hypothetical protein